MSVTEMFSYIQGFLSADQDIREDIRKVVQVLEQTAREILTVLQSVHQPSGFKDIPSKCLKARELFCTVRNHTGELKTKFPVEQYYRYHEHWRFVLQRLAFLAAFVVYLESESLVTREEVAKILAIEVDREIGFHLDVEDYLAGMFQELELMGINSISLKTLLGYGVMQSRIYGELFKYLKKTRLMESVRSLEFCIYLRKKKFFFIIIIIYFLNL
uniref:Translin n=1 Tax=Sinocyclocheilus rhinocerous TaxID=307959 RepID=A0A673N2T0_9TELE